VYLRIALGYVRLMGVPQAAVDWPTVFDRAKAQAKGAKTTADTYPAIRTALEALGEGRGALLEPGVVTTGVSGAYGFYVLFPERIVAVVYPAGAADKAGIKAGDLIETVNGSAPVVSSDPRLRGQFADIPKPHVRLSLRSPGAAASREVSIDVASVPPLPAHTARLGSDIGYVELPGTTGDREFPLHVRASIAQTDAKETCGWIVDLRRNNGGALDGALVALRPFLGEGALGGGMIVDRRVPWSYPAPRPDDPAFPPLMHPDPPVAVLVSRLTATAIAIAFRGRPNTRLFGEATWSLSGLRPAHNLPDGAQLNLVREYGYDRSGHEYTGRFDPDEPVTIDWSKVLGSDADPVTIAAASWLRQQPACQKPGK
jgi:C-terminal processing protease CtpA/Prc